MEKKFINNKQHILQLTIWIVTKHLNFFIEIIYVYKIQSICINKEFYVDFIYKIYKNILVD